MKQKGLDMQSDPYIISPQINAKKMIIASLFFKESSLKKFQVKIPNLIGAVKLIQWPHWISLRHYFEKDYIRHIAEMIASFVLFTSLLGATKV